MSEEYISREAALKAVGALSWAGFRLKEVPAADVRPRWIPVEEQLPDAGDSVLCWYEYYSYSECRMVTDYGMGYQYNGHWAGEATNGYKARVLYWMPWPEPPEEETK